MRRRNGKRTVKYDGKPRDQAATGSSAFAEAVRFTPS
jgi:hypothetical protein